MLSSGDKILIKILIKILWECKKIPAQRPVKIVQQELEKTNIRPLSAEVTDKRFDRTHSRKQSATVVSIIELKTTSQQCQFHDT